MKPDALARFAALAAVLLVAAWFLVPPELVLRLGEEVPYEHLPKAVFARGAKPAPGGPGRNIFVIEPPPVVVKPPRPVDVKVVPVIDKARIEERRMQETRRNSSRFTLVGTHVASAGSPAGRPGLDRAFLCETDGAGGGTIHILLRGAQLLDRYRLEAIGTDSVTLRDETADRLEEVRFPR